MRKSILENLAKIQGVSALFSGGESGDFQGVYWAQGPKGYWPNAMVGNVEESIVSAVIKGIENTELPPFWSFDVEYNSSLVELLEKNDFKEINRWEGMSLQLEDFKPAPAHPDLMLEIVNSEALLNEWVSVVKPVMMPNKKMSSEMLSKWMTNNDFILLVGKKDGKTVTTGMSFMHNGSVGLYFIATLPEFRGKGYAKSLVSELINLSFEKGFTEMVLHASDDGRWVYSKLGFQSEGIISTYWKLGIF